jgi:hypothetical protein
LLAAVTLNASLLGQQPSGSAGTQLPAFKPTLPSTSGRTPDSTKLRTFDGSSSFSD